MKLRRSIWCLIFSLLAASPVSGQGDDRTRRELERMAAAYTHISHTTIVMNRELRLGWFGSGGEAERLVADQLRLLAELRALSGDRAGLVALLKHSDPKVRTLAMSALYQREDGRDLALIAPLMVDTAATFPDLHQTMNSGGSGKRTDFETTQSVAQVAMTMLRPYLGAVWLGSPGGFGGFSVVPATEAKVYAADFTKYWARRQNRERCASWFLVRLRRAVSGATRPQATQKVLAEIDALPPVERAWTLLYVGFESHPSGLLSEDSVVTALKVLGPDKLLDFLQHKPGPDDPDLQYDELTDSGRSSSFAWKASFILKHAQELLRPAAAAALLERAALKETRLNGISPWVGAAVALKHMEAPEQLGEFVRSALASNPLRNVNQRGTQGVLMGALWKTRGLAEKQWLVDWFYLALAEVGGSAQYESPGSFLNAVHAAKRPESSELLTALVADPRFSRTDWAELKAMTAIASSGLPAPLISEKDIQALDWSFQRAVQGQPEHLVKMPTPTFVLPAWRNRLRQHCGLPEVPLPKLPVPQKAISNPTSFTPFAQPPLRDDSNDDRPLQIQFSPDGRWLAILQERQVAIHEAATGKFAHTIGGYIPSPVAIGFFGDGSLLTILDASNGIKQRDLPTQRWMEKTRIKPFDEAKGGHWFGQFAFDSTGDRVASASWTTLGCYDVRERRWFWQKEHSRPQVVALSPNGLLLATSPAESRQVQIVRAETGLPVHRLDDFAGQVYSLAFSPDSQILATATAESGVRLWNTRSGKLVRVLNYPAVKGPGALLYSPQGRWLAVVAASDSAAHATTVRVGIFSADTGELHWEFSEDRLVGGYGIRIAMAFTSDEQRFFTAAGNRLAVWPLN